VAGKSPESFLRAVLGGRWGHDGMEHLGRRREREERSLDRAHRRFLRQRVGRRKGLVESAGEPEHLPPAANENVSEPEPAPAEVAPKVGDEPEAPRPVAAPPTAVTQKVAGEPERAPRPRPLLPQPADPADARALYAEILQHPRRESIEARIRPLPRRPKERRPEVIRGRGCIDKQPLRPSRAWRALVRW
jgi:hypothetical protein